VRKMRGAERESDNFLVMAKIRLKIKSSEKTKKGEIKKWDISKLNKKEVQEVFVKEVIANVQNTQKKWKIQMKHGTKFKKGINEAAVKIIRK